MSITRKPPSITVDTAISQIAFLVSDLEELPDLNKLPDNNCFIRLRVMPCVVLPALEVRPQSPESQSLEPQQSKISEPHVIACQLSSAKRYATSVIFKLAQVSKEAENFYGLSALAYLESIPSFQNSAQCEPTAYLPFGLARQMFARECAAFLAEPAAASADAPGLPDGALIRVHFRFPTGAEWPTFRLRSLTRLSLDLSTRTGGLALNDRELLINSLSRPVRIHTPAGNGMFVDYYSLESTSHTAPVTSDLPRQTEDYTDVINPTAAYLARIGYGGD